MTDPTSAPFSSPRRTYFSRRLVFASACSPRFAFLLSSYHPHLVLTPSAGSTCGAVLSTLSDSKQCLRGGETACLCLLRRPWCSSMAASTLVTHAFEVIGPPVAPTRQGSFNQSDRRDDPARSATHARQKDPLAASMANVIVPPRAIVGVAVAEVYPPKQRVLIPAVQRAELMERAAEAGTASKRS